MATNVEKTPVVRQLHVPPDMPVGIRSLVHDIELVQERVALALNTLIDEVSALDDRITALENA